MSCRMRMTLRCSTSTCTTGRRRPTIDRKSTRLNSSHTEIYTLSLHELFRSRWEPRVIIEEVDVVPDENDAALLYINVHYRPKATNDRSEEHTSELQSHRDLHSFPTRALPISLGAARDHRGG